MRESNRINGRKRGLCHNKNGKRFGRENNYIEDCIKKNRIICFARKSLSEKFLFVVSVINQKISKFRE